MNILILFVDRCFLSLSTMVSLLISFFRKTNSLISILLDPEKLPLILWTTFTLLFLIFLYFLLETNNLNHTETPKNWVELEKYQKDKQEKLNPPKVFSIWRHYKGDLYAVDSISMIKSDDSSENGILIVNYSNWNHPLYFPWSQTLERWNEFVCFRNQNVRRFTEVRDIDTQKYSLENPRRIRLNENK